MRRNTARNIERSLLESYLELARSLTPGVAGLCLFSASLDPCGSLGLAEPETIRAWLRSLGWPKRSATPAGRLGMSGGLAVAIPVVEDENFIGAFVLVISASTAHAGMAAEVASRARPLVECAARELAAIAPRPPVATESAAELEWLFDVTSGLAHDGNRRGLVDLLTAAARRLDAGLAVLIVPEKRLSIDHCEDTEHEDALRRTLATAETHLLQLAQRGRKSVVFNGGAGGRADQGRCRLLSVPLTRANGRVIGVLAFLSAPDTSEFSDRKRFLANHLGRQVTALLETQFDAMTGLYTRSALEQVYATLAQRQDGTGFTVAYLDIDRMQVVNEMYSFEIGDELIIRVASLLAPPILPDNAIAARITGDRFAFLLQGVGIPEATAIAERVRAAATRIAIGPPEQPVQTSVSGGIAAVVDVPQALTRAIASAELACKAAKDHGRGRFEVYQLEDQSILRRQGDVLSVWHLREALREDRMELHAQRVVPLRNPELPESYEVLVRIREPDGQLVSPGAFMGAAERYQLLPSIDRWVFERAAETLAPFRSTLMHCHLSVSLNVSGQSIADETFVARLEELLRRAALPLGAIVLEVAEKTVIENLARIAKVMHHLRSLGCRFAIDDFGTSTGPHGYLADLPVSRVIIDGSIVRDVLTNGRSLAAVRSALERVAETEIETVAKHVENDEIARRLMTLGVDYAQGFTFARPEPLAHVLRRHQEGDERRVSRIILEEI